MCPMERDCGLVLYFPCWQKSGSKARRQKGVGSDNGPELHTIREVCGLIQEPHSVPLPSTIQHTKFDDADFTEL